MSEQILEHKKKEKLDFRTMASYEDYPFQIEGVGSRIYITKEDENLAVVKDSGEVIVIKSLPKTKEVKHDNLSYTKVFKNAAFELKNLSIPASNMLYFIMAKLEINTKHVCLTEEDFMEHCEYRKNSRRLYYQAMAELQQKNVIKKRAGFKRCYWVNANILFNGDRTKII
jgi:hypothetical protein